MKPTVLCVDDDDFVRQTLVGYLEGELFTVLEARNGKELKSIIQKEKVDIILLDLVLPDGDGIAFMQEIRSKVNVPIIIISSKGEDVDRIVGIETGADDYLAKPFSPRELKARINAVLRRSKSSPPDKDDNDDTNTYHFDEWILDPSQYQVYDKNGVDAHLTTSEFLILYNLVLSANKAVSREKLFDITRDEKSETYDRAVDIQITRIRKKINDDIKNPKYIRTVRGIGYLFFHDVRIKESESA